MAKPGPRSGRGGPVTDPDRTVLLVSNVRFDDPGGRAAKFAVRRDLLAEHGWTLEVVHVPEPYLRTFLPSVVRGIRRARRDDVEVVQSVNNPFHLHVIGYLVALFAGVPWVAELRDALVTDPDLGNASIREQLRRIVEWLVVTRSDRLLWGDGIQIEPDYFRERYPDVPADRIVKLPYAGFVAEKFADRPEQTPDEFTITYAGSFYDGWIEPHAFLAGFGRFLDAAGADADATFQVYGDWTGDYQQAARESGVADHVRAHDFVPHEEIVPVLQSSDLLLYVGGSDPKNAENVPSKIWDYIGARRPILAVVDPSFRSARFVEEWDLGLVASPADPAAIADAIAAAYDGEYEYDPDPAAFEQFTRDRFVERLARALEAVAGERDADPEAGAPDDQ